MGNLFKEDWMAERKREVKEARRVPLTLPVGTEIQLYEHGYEEILRSSEFSRRRLGLLIRMRDDLAEPTKLYMIPRQNEQLRAKYAELLGKIDDVMVAESQYLTGLYGGVTDIMTAEAKCLTELLRAQSRGT